MTAEREGLADLLSEHELDLSALRRDRETKAGYWLACTCGFEWTPIEPFDQHRHHLADILAARDRRVRAEAWDEAIDALIDEVCDCGNFHGHPGDCASTRVINAARKLDSEAGA